MGIVWCLVVIAYMTIPKVNHIAAEYSLGALALGALQWVFIVRPRIARHEAGPPASTVETLRDAEAADTAALDK